VTSTLVVLLGNARGGERTWNSMYTHLLEPLGADLALLFGHTRQLDSSLYQRAQYVWEVPEHLDWANYYMHKCRTNNWLRLAKKFSRDGIMGGVGRLKGSGAIILALRDTLMQYQDVLERYDRIILTRSDYYYIADHPDLPNDAIWIVEGEDYGGITDRHHVFPSRMWLPMLDVISFLDSDIFWDKVNSLKHYNPEKFLADMFNFYGIKSSVRRFRRVHFTVATKDDGTRWQKARITMPGEDQLFLKYPGEYCAATGSDLASLSPSRWRRLLSWFRRA